MGECAVKGLYRIFFSLTFFFFLELKQNQDAEGYNKNKIDILLTNKDMNAEFILFLVTSKKSQIIQNDMKH